MQKYVQKLRPSCVATCTFTCSCVTSLTEAGDVQYAHVAATGAERQRLVDARHDVVEETRVDRLAQRVTRARRLANLQWHPAPQTHNHSM